jgi:hypothetical protein
MQINKASVPKTSMQTPDRCPQDVRARLKGRPAILGLSVRLRGKLYLSPFDAAEVPMPRFATVMSQVAEITVFFAAAAALGAGLLQLR